MNKDRRIVLGHGGGGRLTGRLIREVLLPRLDRGKLEGLPDSALLARPADRIAYTTDSFTVSPIFFPGGDIGSLSVHGTCNDLSCAGARPTYLSLALILEEGFLLDHLDQILVSVADSADEAGVEIVTGDTKVVPKGSADQIFVNTSGLGFVQCEAPPALGRISDGDEVIVSGPVGNHGMAVMLSRAEFSFDFELVSDSASVWPLVERLLELGPRLKFLRDPTRGGLAATLNEIVEGSGLGMTIDEVSVPLDKSVAAASEILGIDPLQAANEGKIVAVVEKGSGPGALDLWAGCPLADGAAVIGRMTADNQSRVIMNTRIGGSRILPEPSGELLPRIC